MFVLASLIVLSAAQGATVSPIPGQAPLDAIEVVGVAAGDFNPAMWQADTLNLLPDARHPLIKPHYAGLFRNIYAPSAVQTPEGWRVFFGAWDGVDTPNDRIYYVDTHDFLDFGNHHRIIDHGAFIHTCNVSAIRDKDGSYEIVCTAYPDKQGDNKPAYFTSPDGEHWNGDPAPHKATFDDLVDIEGYDKYTNADINGMNVLFRDGKNLYLYFADFHNFGHVYRATQIKGTHFQFDGPVFEGHYAVNDVKKFAGPDGPVYLMGLHMNQQHLWYALSKDGMHFGKEQTLLTHRDAADKYIVAIGWVCKDNRLLGVLYGAGAVGSLDHNRIFGRWLQRKVVFVADDGTRYEPDEALGPNRQLIRLPEGRHKGHWEVYAEDGKTLLAGPLPADASNGHVFKLDVSDSVH